MEKVSPNYLFYPFLSIALYKDNCFLFFYFFSSHKVIVGYKSVSVSFRILTIIMQIYQ